MNTRDETNSASPDGAEEMVNGIPHRMFDGYDGGKPPSKETIAQLLANAPPEILARAAEFAKQTQSTNEASAGECNPKQ